MTQTPGTKPPAPEAPTITPELLSTSEAARLAGIGERTLWRWSRSGLAPAPVKIGCGLRPMVRFRRADLQAWIDAGCPRTDEKGGGR